MHVFTLLGLQFTSTSEVKLALITSHFLLCIRGSNQLLVHTWLRVEARAKKNWGGGGGGGGGRHWSFLTIERNDHPQSAQHYYSAAVWFGVM